MKLRIPCMQCLQEQGYLCDELMFVELRDDGLYNVICSKKHSTLTVIQEQKYEILFDLAVMALLDGYPREAATGMAASLECFYGFVIRALCLWHGISDDTLKVALKSVANQSERQFGGFIFAYMLVTGDNPTTIDKAKPTRMTGQDWKVHTWKEFRNNVIHKGYIPSISEAIAYGELVFNYIKEITIQLCANGLDSLNKATLTHVACAHKEAGDKHISTMSIPTLLNPNRQGFAARSFEQSIEELRLYKSRIHRS